MSAGVFLHCTRHTLCAYWLGSCVTSRIIAYMSTNMLMTNMKAAQITVHSSPAQPRPCGSNIAAIRNRRIPVTMQPTIQCASGVTWLYFSVWFLVDLISNSINQDTPAVGMSMLKGNWLRHNASQTYPASKPQGYASLVHNTYSPVQASCMLCNLQHNLDTAMIAYSPVHA